MYREVRILDERQREETDPPEALRAIEGDEDILPIFAQRSGPTENHQFAADSQLTVLAIGILAAAAAVFVIAGVEQALSTAIDTGWIIQPPGPETYNLSG